MTDRDTREPIPDDSAFHKLLSFMTQMQGTVDRHVRSLGVPLEQLSDDAAIDLLQRLNRYVEFELDAEEEIDGDIPVCVSGDGILIAVDKNGHPIGSERIDHNDIVMGTVSSLFVRQVPTFHAFQEAQTNSNSRYGDFMFTLAAVVEGGMFYIGVDEDGIPAQEVDLSEYDLHLSLAYPLKFKPIALTTQQSEL